MEMGTPDNPPEPQNGAEHVMETVDRHHSRPTAPALLLVVGAALIGGVVQPVVQGVYLTARVMTTVVLAVAFFVLHFGGADLHRIPECFENHLRGSLTTLGHGSVLSLLFGCGVQ